MHQNRQLKSDPLPARRFTPAEHQAWYENIMGIYSRMRAKAKHGPHEVQFAGLTLTVLPNVYDPVGFTDTLWFAGQLTKIVGTRSLLEIGTGSGAIAIVCAKNGARVVATDVNPDAVKNTLLNAERCHLDISVRQSDLYAAIKPEERFDFIFWSHPFNNWDAPVDDMLLRSGLDYRYEGMRGYIAGAKKHLEKDGRLLLGTGDSADLQTISDIATEHGYRMSLVSEISDTLEPGRPAPIKLLLYELVPT